MKMAIMPDARDRVADRGHCGPSTGRRGV